MAALKKATVYLDPEVHKAVRMKAAADDQSVSDLVNDALKAYLNEDAVDLLDIEHRRSGPFVSYEEVVKSLKKDGIL